MTATYRLPDRLDIHGDESLPGYAMRYAALYGFDSPLDLFARLQIKGKRTLTSLLSEDPSTTEGADILDLLNIPQERRASLSLWSANPKNFSVRGNSIPFLMTHIKTRRCCPACLATEPYHRAAWLVAALPACSIHGSLLIGECPACRTTLRWRGTTAYRCPNQDCALDLRELETPRVTEGERRAIAGLVDLLGGGTHPAGYGFSDAIRAVLTLGGLRMEPMGQGRLKQALGVRRDKLPAVLEAGWSVITPWPSAFNDYLDELLVGASGRTSSHGLTRAYGHVARRLSDNHKCPWGGPLVTLMTDRLVGHPHIALRTPVVKRHGTGANEFDRRLTVEEAAKLIGVSSSTMDRIAKRLELEGSGKASHEPRQLRRVDVEALAADRGRSPSRMSQRQAAIALGIDSETLKTLVSAGILNMAKVGDLDTKPTISRCDIERIIDRLERGAVGKPHVTTVGPEHRRIGRGGLKDGLGLAKLIPLVLEGRLEPVAVLTTREGLPKYVFPRSHPAFASTKATVPSR